MAGGRPFGNDAHDSRDARVGTGINRQRGRGAGPGRLAAQLTLGSGRAVENLGPARRERYKGEAAADRPQDLGGARRFIVALLVQPRVDRVAKSDQLEARAIPGRILKGRIQRVSDREMVAIKAAVESTRAGARVERDRP